MKKIFTNLLYSLTVLVSLSGCSQRPTDLTPAEEVDYLRQEERRKQEMLSDTSPRNRLRNQPKAVTEISATVPGIRTPNRDCN